MAGKIFIALEDLNSALGRLAEKLDIWIPALSKENGAGTEFLLYRAGLKPVLEKQSTLPPKKILLPQVESLLRFEYRKDPEEPAKTRMHLDDSLTLERQSLVFGARPCDVRGFLTFDRVFTCGPHVDGYYQKRRENTLFATLVCREPDGACFCSSVGSGPSDMAGSDFRVAPVSGGFVVEALSEKAKPLIDLMGKAATAEQEEEAKRVIEEASKLRVEGLDANGSREAFLKRFEDKGYWQQSAAQCLSCGICTYVCPTCYCFTITDEVKNLKGERLRSWDSCMFCHYTSEASGHNPRPTKLERYRNRVGHKFSYIPEKYEGLIGCCGCGRCIRSCPVSIDIRKVVEHLKEETCECA